MDVAYRYQTASALAGADPAAAAAAASAAATAAAALLPARPPGLHLLLELAAHAAAVSAAPPLPPAIDALSRSRDRTKLAEAARRLSRLTGP